jgi:hypothetical protein
VLVSRLADDDALTDAIEGAERVARDLKDYADRYDAETVQKRRQSTQFADPFRLLTADSLPARRRPVYRHRNWTQWCLGSRSLGPVRDWTGVASGTSALPDRLRRR